MAYLKQAQMKWISNGHIAFMVDEEVDVIQSALEQLMSSLKSNVSQPNKKEVSVKSIADDMCNLMRRAHEGFNHLCSKLEKYELSSENIKAALTKIKNAMHVQSLQMIIDRDTSDWRSALQCTRQLQKELLVLQVLIKRSEAKPKTCKAWIERSSKLIEAGHRLLHSFRKIDLALPGSHHCDVAELRQNLNNALAAFEDATTTYRVHGECSAEKIIICGKALLRQLRNARLFFHDVSIGGQAEKQSQDVQEAANCSQSASVYREIAQALTEAVCQASLLKVEREINALTDHLTCLREFERCLCRNRSDVSDFEDARRSTRLLVQCCKKLCFSDRDSKDARFHLDFLAEKWAAALEVLLKSIHESLQPWSGVMSMLFPRVFDAAPRKLSADKAMTVFERVEEQLLLLCSKVNAYVSRPCLAERKGTSAMPDVAKKFKLGSSRIKQLFKLHLTGSIPPSEYPQHLHCMLGWAASADTIIRTVDSLSRSALPSSVAPPCTDVSIEDASFKSIASSHGRWTKICEQVEKCSSDVAAVRRMNSLRDGLTKEFRGLQLLEASDKDAMQLAMFRVAKRQWLLGLLLIADTVNSTHVHVSSPLEALCRLAFSDQRRDSFSHLEASQSRFAQMKSVFSRKMDRIRIHVCLAVERAPYGDQVHEVLASMDRLDALFEKVVSHFEVLHEKCQRLDTPYESCYETYEWLAEANHLLYILRKVPDVRFAGVSAIMRHLATSADVSRPDEFLDVLNDHGTSRCLPTDDGLDFGSPSCDMPYATLFDRDIPFTNIPGRSSSQLVNQHNEVGHEAKKSRPQDKVSSPKVTSFFSNFHSDDDRHCLIPTDSGIDSVCEDVEQSLSLGQLPSLPPHKTVGREQGDQKAVSFVNKKGLPSSPDVSTSRSNIPPRHDVKSPCQEQLIGEPASKSILAAAHLLHREAESWDEDGNSIVKLVKEMARQMYQMAEFSNGRGSIKSRNELIQTAKAIAANANTVAKFAAVIADHCENESCREDLLKFAELLPTISTQLRIVSSVKAVVSEDDTTNNMLITNADNLMKAVVGTLKSAEAASVQVSKLSTASVAPEVDLAFAWRRKSRLHQAMEVLSTPKGDLGLRFVPRLTSGASLAGLAAFPCECT